MSQLHPTANAKDQPADSTRGDYREGRLIELDDTQADRLALELDGKDPEQFGRLVEKYLTPIYNYLLQLSGSVHDAEDLTQETFLRAYLHIHQFRFCRSFRAWLFRIARTVFLNWTRKKRQLEAISEDGAEQLVDRPGIGPQTSTVDPPEPNDLGSIWTLARRLTQREFELLWLKYVEGLSSREIASVTGLAPIHIRVLLYRARRRLLKLLNDSELGRELLREYKDDK